MISVFERARSYVGKMPAAVSGQGGHDATFEVACVLVKGFSLPVSDAALLLAEYNERCQPKWREGELAHKLRQAQGSTRPDGYLLGQGEWRASDRSAVAAAPERRVRYRYDEGALRKLADGRKVDVLWLANRSVVDPASVDSEGFLRAIFRGGEKAIVLADDRTQGVVWPDEALPVAGPRGMWFLAQPVDGVMRQNPRSGKGSRRSAESVTSWRYALLESDEAPAGLWLAALVSLRAPVAAIYTSGGRSVHVLWKVDANSLEHWRELMGPIKEAFGIFGVDEKAMTPVRLSRLPQQPRAEKNGFQRLLYVNPLPLCDALMELPVRRDVVGYWMKEGRDAWLSQDVTRMRSALRGLNFYGHSWAELAAAAKDLAAGLKDLEGGDV
jgi:hypothetical protein